MSRCIRCNGVICHEVVLVVAIHKHLFKGRICLDVTASVEHRAIAIQASQVRRLVVKFEFLENAFN